MDHINKELVKFVVELSQLPLSEKDHKYVSTTFHTISDLERIGDYAENIMEYADTLKSENEGFSESGRIKMPWTKPTRSRMKWTG